MSYLKMVSVANSSGMIRRVYDAATARAVGLERAVQAGLGVGCHTAFGAHVTHDTLYFYHEGVGRHSIALTAADFAAPPDTADRILKQLGLR